MKIVAHVLNALAFILLILGLGFPGCVSSPGLYFNLLYILPAVALLIARRVILKFAVKNEA